MTLVRMRTRLAVGALVFTVCAFGVGAVGASATLAAEGPVWRVLSVSDPTNLAAPVDDTQEIKGEAKEGSLFVLIPESPLTGEGKLLSVTDGASAMELQEAFAGALGAGNVRVTGGAGAADAEGFRSFAYTVKFAGALAGKEVPQVLALVIGGEERQPTEVKVLAVGASGGELTVTAVNVGGASDGSPVTLSDTLPATLKATSITGFDSYADERPLSCSTPPTLSCTGSGIVEPGDTLVMQISVEVQVAAGQEPPTSVVDQAAVSGGGAEVGASADVATTIASTSAEFGVAPSSVLFATSTHQAGGHPNVTTAFSMNTSGPQTSAGDPRDVRFDLPPGLVGNTVGMPQCATAKAVVDECPTDTVVGVATVTTYGPSFKFVVPVFNVTPAPGEPAAFVFRVNVGAVRLDTSVLSDGSYGVRVTAGNLNQTAEVLSSYVTIWGIPADHEGPGPIAFQVFANGVKFYSEHSLGGPSVEASRVPLLSNPTQCSTALTAGFAVDSWADPGVFQETQAPVGTDSGCELLRSEPSISMLPDTLQAGAPAGYTFGLHVPQSNDPERLATPNVRRVVTRLPMGTVISPSAAWGLAACTSAEFFGSERGLQRPAKSGECPRESQVGTVQITTPALALPLTGDVYLAAPECDPCTPEDAQDGRMVRLFVQVVGEGNTGIVVKIEGTGSIDQQTGQLTFTFEENPQLPFSDLKLVLGGGPRATLSNPRACGPASTALDLTPWSTPFNADSAAVFSFEVTGCYAPQFNPVFQAGSTNIQAGEYSPFTLSFGRHDQDQFLNGFQQTLPPGLLGKLAGVALCKEPQASEGTCSPESLIGHAQVLTGPGADPYLVSGGQVFITEGYKSAPYGLSIVVPAVAGPYTLAGTTGHGTVVVRAAISVDPSTAALTVTADPLPTELDGIPLQLQVVNVTIDRPQFTFNPTSCNRMAISATLTSVEGLAANVASPFQVTNCQGLGFKPQFKVSAHGHTSRADGASLDAKVIYPSGAKQANIARVKVELPKQLPSRLTTLQKACTAAVFQANPANCPVASRVGIARASTPVLPVELTGPAYFVSHGGEAFPSLIVVLQGNGVRVDLVGATFISKAGITSSTFASVPDVPISSFELYLPEGPDSALAANADLCKSSLAMPTEIVGQNGAVIHQSTKIKITGCARPKAKKGKAARHRRRARGAKQSRRASDYSDTRKGTR